MGKRFLSLLIVICVAVISYGFLAMPSKALSLKDAFSAGGPLNTVGGGAGFNTVQRIVDPIIGNIISVILSFLGVIFLILMIYGGYTWMTAMGNEEKVKRAQQMIIAAVLGLIVVVGAYAITVFVIGRMTGELVVQNSALGQ